MTNHIHVVLFFVRNVLFDDESDDVLEVLEKIDNYAETTVPLMTDNQFKRHFRMTAETFENLLLKLHRCMEINRNLMNNINTGGYPRTTLEKELMITIWYLGNIESLRCVADRFGVSKSTCWDIVYRLCRLLLQANERFQIICWPNEQRQAQISQNFNAHNFPGVVGCIDGSHIPITAPKENRNSYVNRKGYHSLILQGVCDDRLLFTAAYAGQAGSLHDQNVFQKSDLYAAFQQNHIHFHNDSHLLGDLAYSLNVQLLVGFKNNGHLSMRQKKFNTILSKMRVKIENAFALLKGRFRKLKHMETVRLELATLLIFSACVLHNVCILNDDLLEDIVNIEEERHLELLNNPNNEGDDLPEVIARNALIKRANIMNNLPMIIRQ